MVTLTATRGLPGSGKTTWARKQPGAVRANRDDLRMGLFGKFVGLTWDQENLITKAQLAIAEAALADERDVIVDDMNLRPKYLNMWHQFAVDHGADFVVKEFHRSIQTCIDRDQTRERVVGDQVIRDIAAKQMPNGKFLPWEPPVSTPVEKVVAHPGLPGVYIVDIDGTMTTGPKDRSPYDWSKVGQDDPRWPVVELVERIMMQHPSSRIIFLSGRDGSCYDITEEWLRRLFADEFDGQWSLIMRKEGDNRKDSVVKRELFDQHIRNQYNVRLVLDDRDQVVKMWRSLGLTCLQVDYGNF